MKRFIILSVLILALLVLIPTCVWLTAPAEPMGTVSLILMGVTNNVSGQRVALFSFTNGSSVSVVAGASFVSYKQGDTWVKQTGDWEFDWDSYGLRTYSLGNNLAPHKSQPLAIRFPTNTAWKFSLSCNDRTTGMNGVKDRLRDFAIRLRTRVHHTSYNGGSFTVESLEITN